MKGHTMRVILDRDVVRLVPVCHEPDGAICRVACPQGCESYSYPEHEHGLEPVANCNAVECLLAGDMVVEMCEETVEFPLCDGMQITMSWDGDAYYWNPVRSETTP